MNAAREPLRGEVEVDDTWVGGEQAGLRGSRQLKERRAALVLVAVEKRGQASGRVRMSVIPDFKAATIMPFLAQNIAPGSTIYTARPQELLRSVGGRLSTCRSQPTPSIGVAQRGEVRRTTCRSCDWEPPTVADWHLPRSEQGPTPGLPQRIRVSTQPSQDARSRISDTPWSRNQPQINRVRADSGSEGSSTPTYWGLLKQPDN